MPAAAGISSRPPSRLFRHISLFDRISLFDPFWKDLFSMNLRRLSGGMLLGIVSTLAAPGCSSSTQAPPGTGGGTGGGSNDAGG